MAFLQAGQLTLSFGDRELFREVSLNLGGGDRLALAGANGSGKSTLLKILANLASPDTGSVVMSKGARVGYLPQSGILMGQGSVYQEAEKAFDDLAQVERDLEELGENLTRPGLSPQETARLLDQFHECQETLEDSGYHRRKEFLYETLQGLGFSADEIHRPASEFSGGWQMRAALARVLLRRPDILLLDEPTNYLDLESKAWLEGFIGRFKGSLLLVSHDRGFLDQTVNAVAELFLGKLKIYKGNYSHYERVRKLEYEALIKSAELQKEAIAKTEVFIDRFRYKASKAAQVQSRVKELEKIQRIELPEHLKPIHFRFPPAPHSGKKVLEIVDLSKKYGDHTVIPQLDLVVERGEKIVVAGRNGAGKTTLLKILSGTDLRFGGKVLYGSGVKVAYFSQDYEAALTPGHTIEEEIGQNAPTAMIPQIRSLLGAFLFRGDDIMKTVGVLSGGEKNRVSLLKLLLEPANLLILDEPTNHLDLASKDVLLSALKQYEGTLLFVSHDRYFIQNLATKVLEMGPGGPRIFQGNYDEFQVKVHEEELAGVSDGPPEPRSTPEVKPQAQISREETKKRQSELRRMEKREAALTEELEKLEREKKSCEEKMALPEFYRDGEKVKGLRAQIHDVENQEARLQEEWMNLLEEMEAFKTV